MPHIDYRRLAILDVVLHYWEDPIGFFRQWNANDSRRAMLERFGLDEDALGLLIEEDLGALAALGKHLGEDTADHVARMQPGAKYGGNKIYVRSAAPLGPVAAGAPIDVSVVVFVRDTTPLTIHFVDPLGAWVPASVVTDTRQGARRDVRVQVTLPTPGEWTLRVSAVPETFATPQERYDELPFAVVVPATATTSATSGSASATPSTSATTSPSAGK